MASGAIQTDRLAQYQRDGYILQKAMFDKDEIGLLQRAAKEDRALDKHSFGKGDGEGGTVRLSLWNHPGDTIYGMFARCESIVDSAESLLEGEVYHYHSKMIMKDAKVGGAWAWHQDYGYWYQNGVLFPLLTSAYIAVDPSTRENGCLQVLKGSHKMGRIDHVLTGDQAGADLERVRHAEERLELVYVEMEPGDVLFFDANLLHRSDQNRSDNPRWSMICCYNAARNDPYKEAHHPRYTPLQKVPDSAIREAGLRRFTDSESNVAWLDEAEDKSASSLETQSRPVFKCYFNLLALDGLSPLSFSEIQDAGFDGVQFASPASRSELEECHRLGLEYAASGRIDEIEDTNPLAEQWAGEGALCATLHVGRGLESQANSCRLIDSILSAATKYKFPLYVETHRATIFQDMWRTVEFVRQFPDLRFNGDFSHWYTGQEMVYGGFETKFQFIQPVLERVRFIHGRIGTPGCIQVALRDETPEPEYVLHFKQLWTACFRYGAQIFTPELLAPKIYYGRTFPGPDGQPVEECDRWQQSLLLKKIAEDCFREAAVGV